MTSFFIYFPSVYRVCPLVGSPFNEATKECVVRSLRRFCERWATGESCEVVVLGSYIVDTEKKCDAL